MNNGIFFTYLYFPIENISTACLHNISPWLSTFTNLSKAIAQDSKSKES